MDYKQDLRKEIDAIFYELDPTLYINFAELLYKFKSNSIYFIGIGKSNNVAKHCSDILKSLGYTSFNLSYTDLLHGDLGVVSEKDLLILVSNSGNTREFVNTIELIKVKKCYIHGIFGNREAKLKIHCNTCSILRKCNELDKGFNMIPSTSIINYNIFFTLTVRYLLDIDEIKLEDYGKNHPAGNIGSSIWTKVRHKMKPIEEIPYFYIENIKNTSLFDIMLLMDSKKMGICSFVDKNYKLIGIITNGCLIKFISEKRNLDTVNILDLLTYSPITIADKTDERIDKLNLKITHRYFPVIEENKLVGIYQNIM